MLPKEVKCPPPSFLSQEPVSRLQASLPIWPATVPAAGKQEADGVTDEIHPGDAFPQNTA